jgi:hypothetical protein
MRRRTSLSVIAAALFLGGCASPSAAEPTSSPTSESTPTPPTRADVDWSRYPDDYQRIIDEEMAEKDCGFLQEMFDVAPDDGQLLTYIDEALELAGCYEGQ